MKKELSGVLGDLCQNFNAFIMIKTAQKTLLNKPKSQ